MTYREAEDFLEKISNLGSDPGLERIKKLLNLLENPEKDLKFIHIAGTNGKGSTAAMLSHILSQSCYRTGLYTSPCVISDREKIKINNQIISEEAFASIVQKVKKYWDILDREGNPPTLFEFETATAMVYFAEQKCDIVVLETGMGGRLDATNIISSPLVSVITKVAIDHVGFLGNTFEEIAVEKAGIIKPKGKTVTSFAQEDIVMNVLKETCLRKENRITVGSSPKVIEQKLDCTAFCYESETYEISLFGNHQIENAITAIETTKALTDSGFIIAKENLKVGLKKAALPARFEAFKKDSITIILDGAHNPSGALVLKEALKLQKNHHIYAITGMLEDKDISGILSPILPLCDSVITLKPKSNRAMSAEKLAEAAHSFCKKVVPCENALKALAKSLDICRENDILLIFGSLYLASEIRPLIIKQI